MGGPITFFCWSPQFYVKDGKTLPGSKGISLSLEQVRVTLSLSVFVDHFPLGSQWTLIKESVGLIDEMIEGLKTEAS